MVIAPKEKSLFTFWKKVRFEGGERETDLLVHSHWTNSLFSFLVSFLFFSVFFLIFFLFFLLCFFFSFLKIYSVFDPHLQGTAKAFL